MRSSGRYRSTGGSGGMNMGRAGGTIAIFFNILYLLGAGLSGYLIRDTLKENKTVATSLYVILAMCILMPIMVLSIYLSMNKNTKAEKEKVNTIIGWTSMVPLIIMMVIVFTMGY
jgi:hypothetical protein